MSKPCRFPTSRKNTKKEGKRRRKKQQRVRQQGNDSSSLCKHDDLREVKRWRWRRLSDRKWDEIISLLKRKPQQDIGGSLFNVFLFLFTSTVHPPAHHLFTISSLSFCLLSPTVSSHYFISPQGQQCQIQTLLSLFLRVATSNSSSERSGHADVPRASASVPSQVYVS